MNRPNLLCPIFCLSAAHILNLSVTITNLSAQTAPPTPLAGNPLSVESTLPYHLPPFDKIKDSDFQPAIETGMVEQLKEVEAIAANPEKATFDNTIVALERTGQLLDRAERTFSNQNACNTNPALQKTEADMAPKLAAHSDAIHLNGKLFARVQDLYSSRDTLSLDPEATY